ncbi:Leucine rich repeat N-terminal domain [Musa troglodytarum]|uniref:Leucine rich repeat N-terminal domain n=1 Tax=Musa troglodytarum TaxID=320322 RepID=A0A9E7JWY3_9LILI|nr:Leucine rich repeat N-terminal domain [Musa troglodytarum]
MTLEYLNYLDLSMNDFQSSIPDFFGSYKNLGYLNLSGAGFLTTVPQQLGNLSSLLYLDLSYNNLDIASIPYTLPQLNFTYLSILDLSNNQINSTLPSWLFKLTALEYLFLAENYLHSSVSIGNMSYLKVLDLSNNLLEGPLPSIIGEAFPSLESFFLRANYIAGSIPSSICKLEQLIVLDLSENHLSHELPSCWKNSSVLQVINLSNNTLSGQIPKSILTLNSLVILDLGLNRFGGCLPRWLGERMPALKILILRQNMFYGHIPPSIAYFPVLQIMDLSHNNLSGTIPTSFEDLNAMKFAQNTVRFTPGSDNYYTDSISVVTKGRESRYVKILSLLTAIDLSDNDLSGSIPEEITNLSGLHSLDLSNNHLAGQITMKIGGLRNLESLDLSHNELTGPVPSTLTTLDSLGFLNLSFNKLSGKIPSGNHLETFGPSCYTGNPDLYGYPLNKENQDTKPSQDPNNIDTDVEAGEMFYFYLSLGPGFVVGFWSVWGILLYKQKWRHAYFCFIDNICDKLYVTAKVNFARMKIKLFRSDQGYGCNP